MNKELKGHTDVARIFSNLAAQLPLAGAVLIEDHDEWEAANRRSLTGVHVRAGNHDQAGREDKRPGYQRRWNYDQLTRTVSRNSIIQRALPV